MRIVLLVEETTAKVRIVSINNKWGYDKGDACLPQNDYAEKQKKDRNALTYHYASLVEN